MQCNVYCMRCSTWAVSLAVSVHLYGHLHGAAALSDPKAGSFQDIYLL